MIQDMDLQEIRACDPASIPDKGCLNPEPMVHRDTITSHLLRRDTLSPKSPVRDLPNTGFNARIFLHSRFRSKNKDRMLELGNPLLLQEWLRFQHLWIMGEEEM